MSSHPSEPSPRGASTHADQAETAVSPSESVERPLGAEKPVVVEKSVAEKSVVAEKTAFIEGSVIAEGQTDGVGGGTVAAADGIVAMDGVATGEGVDVGEASSVGETAGGEESEGVEEAAVEEAKASANSEAAKGPWVGRRVAVLYGSDSPEREISLATGTSMHQALVSLGYEAQLIDVNPQALARLASEPPDVAVVALHGTIGENGSIQGFLECLGVPYTGAGVYSSALAMNKATAKGIWASAGLPTPWWQLLSRDRARALLDKKVGEMGIATPCVIKPATGGSSVGISLVQRLGQLPSALRKALRHPGPVMAEGFIEGRELSVAIMDGHVMGVVEIVPMTTFYDYHAKYGQDSGTEYRLPAPLPSQVHQEVVRVSTEAHRLLQGRGVVRVDLLLDTQDRPWLLELNTVPGMTETSLVPKIAAQTGMSFARFVEMMLNRACLDVEMDHA